jgi:hypothetical protein
MKFLTNLFALTGTLLAVTVIAVPVADDINVTTSDISNATYYSTNGMTPPSSDPAEAVQVYSSTTGQDSMTFDPNFTTIIDRPSTNNSLYALRKPAPVPWGKPDWYDDYGPISKGYFSVIIIYRCQPFGQAGKCYIRPYARLYGQNMTAPTDHLLECPPLKSGPGMGAKPWKWNSVWSWLPWTVDVHVYK